MTPNTRNGAILLFLGALGVTAGCGSSSVERMCTSNEDCATGERCVDGVCEARSDGGTTPTEDAGQDGGTEPGPLDGGSPPDDAAVEDGGEVFDAGPTPIPCDRPGALETVACGFCGEQERFCLATGVWEYGECMGELPDAECLPGTVDTIGCGRCGTQPARCLDTCMWDRLAECAGETGECVPGESGRTEEGCPEGSSQFRACEDSCSWRTVVACEGVISDFDGDESPYGTDCDDRDPTIFPGETQACGNFACGIEVGRITYREGVRTCTGPGWSECVRPADCPEPTGTTLCSSIPTATESRPCPRTALCGAEAQVRRCAGGTWTEWSMCEEATEIPEACLTPLELPCGACNEGRRYESCDGLCNVGSSECYGRGCTPGAITRTTEGCPDGEFKDVVCSESCEPTDAACGPFLPDVDIMLLVDTTGSHTTVVRNNATVLATELVAPLLADSDVRVGIATFADFPVGSYGRSGDTPFSAVQELTDDLALVSSTIEVLPAQAGADGPESVVEALHVLAGGDPHPLSQPLFTCPSGTGRGGCWRPGSQRVIVLLTDASQHNIPHPADTSGGLYSPYGSDLSPPAPEWEGVRAALNAEGIALFAIVPAGTGTATAQPQIEQMVTDLGQDPASAVVIRTTTDLGPACTTLAGAISSYVGL